MKRHILVALLAMLLFPSAGFAGDVSVFGTAHDGEDDPGWGAGARASFDIIDWFAIETRAAWLGDISSKAKTTGDSIDVDTVPIDLGGALKLWPNGPINPYINGGATWGWLRPNKGSHDDDWGWYAGGGFTLPLTREDRDRARQRSARQSSERREQRDNVARSETEQEAYERAYPPREQEMGSGPALFAEVLYRELLGKLDTNDIVLDGQSYDVNGVVGNIGLSWRW